MSEPISVPAYLPGREIARGGMGAVLNAQDHKFSRSVAMKVMLRGSGATDEEKQRFLQEARVLGQLAHPNIVPVHDVGTDEQGRLFYTMKLVQGVTLNQVLAKLKTGDKESFAKYPLNALLNIFQKVCDAVAFAHSRGIIHRDLKPQNIMVGEFGEVLVMDWGLAKILPGSPAAMQPAPAFSFASDKTGPTGTVVVGAGEATVSPVRDASADLTTRMEDATLAAQQPDETTMPASRADEVTLASGTVRAAAAASTAVQPVTVSSGTYATLESAVMGTPNYMSPEQAAGHIAELDARSDVYSLGGILYALLALRPPVEGDSLEEILSKVRSGEITPPSASNTGSAATRARGKPGGKVVEPAVFVPLPHLPGGRVPGALSAVAMRAMALDRRDRYPAVAELSADVTAFLGGFATRAEHATAWMLFCLFVRRHKTLAFALAAGLVLTAGSMAKVISSERKATRNAGLARVSELKAVAETGRATDALAANRRQLIRINAANGMREFRDGDTFGAMRWFAENLRLVAGDANEERLHRVRLTAVLNQCPQISQLWVHDDQMVQAEYSPNGHRVLAAGVGRAVFVWDAVSGETVCSLKTPGALAQAAFAAQGRWIVTACRDKTGRVWDAQTGAAVSPPLTHLRSVERIAVSPDARRVATADLGGNVTLWRTTDWTAERTLTNHQAAVAWVAFSPDGAQVATASADKSVAIHDADTGALIRKLVHGHSVPHLDFSPDGQRIVTACFDGAARIWNPATGKAVTPPLIHQDKVVSARFSKDGTRVVTASWDGTARIWNAADGQAVTTPLKHAATVLRAEFSPDARWVLTASSDGTARVWEAATAKPVTPPLKHGRFVADARFTPDGTRLVTACADGTVRLWDLTPRGHANRTFQHGEKVNHAQFSPDGRWVVSSSWDKTARVWDAATGKSVSEPFGYNTGVIYSEFSPDGKRVACADAYGAARVWDIATGEGVSAYLRHGLQINRVSFSRDGTQMATASSDKTARVWDARTGEPRTPALMHEGAVWRASFDPDGRRVVTASNDKTARVWDTRTGALALPPLTHNQGVYHAAFSADGQWILTASSDLTAKVWDARTGAPLLTLKHNSPVNSVALSPDKQLIVTGCEDGSVGIWEAANGNPLRQPSAHGARVRHVEFSPDSRWIATASEDGTAGVFDARSGEPVVPPLTHGAAVRSASFSPDGSRVLTASMDFTARVWNLSVDDRPVARLISLVELLTSQHLDPAGGVSALDPETLRKLWAERNLHEKGTSSRAPRSLPERPSR